MASLPPSGACVPAAITESTLSSVLYCPCCPHHLSYLSSSIAKIYPLISPFPSLPLSYFSPYQAFLSHCRLREVPDLTYAWMMLSPRVTQQLRRWGRGSRPRRVLSTACRPRPDDVNGGDMSSSLSSSDRNHCFRWKLLDYPILTKLEPDPHPHLAWSSLRPAGGHSPCHLGRTRTHVAPSDWPEYSDGPDNDTDGDLTNVPLDYGRLEGTKLCGAWIEKECYKILWGKDRQF